MSIIERFTDSLARSIAGLVVRRAHPVNRELALAMHAEMDSIDRPSSRLKWAAGSLSMLGAPAPAGGAGYFGPLARNLLAFAAFGVALRLGMRLRPEGPEDWLTTSTVISAATLIWWLTSLALRATVMSYASAGQMVFGAVTLAAHLTFGIRSVQGGEIYFSIMGAATLAATYAGWLRSREQGVAICLLMGIGCAVLNAAVWVIPFGVGRFALVPNQVTLIVAGILGSATGIINVARLGPDRPLSQVMEA